MPELTTHGACGKSWVQSGNRTGHCPAKDCHQTFQGSRLFDWHQKLTPEGQVICRTPNDEEWIKSGLVYDEERFRWHLPWDASQAFSASP